MLEELTAGTSKNQVPTLGTDPDKDSIVTLSRDRYIKVHLIGLGSFASVYLARPEGGSTENRSEYSTLRKPKRASLAKIRCVVGEQSTSTFTGNTFKEVAGEKKVTNHVALKKTLFQYGSVELKAFQKLNPHKNIVSLLDYSIIGDSFYLALEVGDCTLCKLVGLWGVDKITLSMRSLNFLLHELLEMYTYAKGKGCLDMVDFHGENVLYFKEEKRLKLTDFGHRSIRGDIGVLSSIGWTVHQVLSRLSHKCEFIPYESVYLSCTDCPKQFGALDTNNPPWNDYCETEYSEMVFDLIDGEIDLNKIKILKNKISKKIYFLPEPKSLVSAAKIDK